MVRINLDGQTDTGTHACRDASMHIHQTVIVTIMSCSAQAGSTKINFLGVGQYCKRRGNVGFFYSNNVFNCHPYQGD